MFATVATIALVVFIVAFGILAVVPGAPFSPTSPFGRRKRIATLVKNGVDEDRAKVVVFTRDTQRGFDLNKQEWQEVDRLKAKYGVKQE